MGYKYRGKVLDAHIPEPEWAPTPADIATTTEPGKYCGTTTGYRHHMNRREEACPPCKEACRQYSLQYRARIRNGEQIKKSYSPDRCGSYAGFRRHQKYGLTPCDHCKAAYREYMRQWRAKQKRAA